MHPGNFVLAGVLGALLGAAELVSRYRDRPTQLLNFSAVWFYILLNLGASIAALALIEVFGWDFGQTGSSEAAVQVLVAGLGSALLFRSSLFTFKIGNENVGVGLNLIMESLLASADRAVDRGQARQRLKDVRSSMSDVSFQKANQALVAACLAAAANVPAEEALDLKESVDALVAATADDHSKAVTLGILIIHVVGADVLAQAVETLGETIKRPT